MKYYLLILLSLAAFSTMLRAVEVSDQKMTTYENTKMGYSIKYPSNWTKNTDVKDFDIFIMAPKNDEGRSVANMSIISGELPEDVSLELFAQENIKSLLKDNSSMEIKKKGENKFGGVTSNWIHYTRSDNHTEIIHYFFVNNHIGYLITFGAAQEAFKEYQPAFEEMIQSFKLQSIKQ